MKLPKYIWAIPILLVALWCFWHFVYNRETRQEAIMEKQIGPLPEK